MNIFQILGTILPAMIIIMLIANACSDSPMAPPVKKKHKHGQGPAGSATNFKPVILTIRGIGTNKMSSSLKPVSHPKVVPSTANLTRPSGNTSTNEGTIQVGTRSGNGYYFDHTNNVLYFWSTFAVRNATYDGEAYNSIQHNLTFLAANASSSASYPTIGKSATVQIWLKNGDIMESGTHKTYLADHIIPTGRVAPSESPPDVIQTDVLQVFTEAEVAGISTATGVTPFPYGFVTHTPNVTPGSRNLPIPTSSNEFDGKVTFAFKIPLKNTVKSDNPFQIQMLFIPVAMAETWITQSLEEQSPEGRELIDGRVTSITADTTTILPGSSYRGSHRLLCGPVRVAGTPTDIITKLFPTLTSKVNNITPDPYATGGSPANISSSTAFSATFNINNGYIDGNYSRSFVVRGRQSGIQFLSSSGYAKSGNTVTAPTASFLPGEKVEVSLTAGMGICPGKVYHYRVKTNPASPGTFTQTSSNPSVAGDVPRGIAVGDFNGDGNLDLAVANLNSDNVSLLLGDGNDGFSEATSLGSPFSISGNGPRGIIAGDFDRDGDLDLAVANRYSDNISILLNNGSGVFTETATYPAGNGPRSVKAGDFDADGDLDLAVADQNSREVTVLLSNGDGTFEPAGSYSVVNKPRRITIGDFNNDGILDLAATNFVANTISVLLGNGNGTFGTAITRSVPGGDPQPFAIGAGDFNEDGNLDLVIGDRHNSNIRVFKGDGTGHFSLMYTHAVGTNNHPVRVAIGDFNGDGHLDIALLNGHATSVVKVIVFLGNGNGDFTAHPLRSPGIITGANHVAAIAAGDFDGDGDLDLAIANRGNDNVIVLQNE